MTRPGTPSSLTPALIVHGGAGEWPRAEHEGAVEGCKRAAALGLELLERGARALDAVIASTRVLEDQPLFNAGIGSVLSREGLVETDASIMDGANRDFGAVAAVPDGYPAIELARAVLDDGEHVLLSGDRVWEFANARGFSRASPNSLITERSQRKLAEYVVRRESSSSSRLVDSVDPGTVGAVAIDANGNVAVATSTGGTTFKRAGRIGDTPLPGGGSYADNRSGAASATGHGETIARVLMTRFCIEKLSVGQSAAEAAWASVEELASISGDGGIIVCDALGRLASAHNSEVMPHAGGRVGGDLYASMKSDHSHLGEGI